MKQAKVHYEKQLLRRFIWATFVELMHSRDQREEKAAINYDRALKRAFLHKLRTAT